MATPADNARLEKVALAKKKFKEILLQNGEQSIRQNVLGEFIDVPLSLDDKACSIIINLTFKK